MSRLRVHCFAISLDGYGAGPGQDLDNPLGGGSFSNIGAWILGRNMFGPIRGSWPDDSWKGCAG